MIPHIPWYLTLIVLTTDLAIVVGVWRILASATARTILQPTQQRRMRIGVAVFLAAWLSAAFLLAPSPASLVDRNLYFINPLIPIFSVLPLVVVLLALAFSASFRATLAALSLPAIIGVQLYRSVGAIFLVLLAMGQLPGHFALPAGWGDIAIGVSAPLVALALARGARGSKTLAYVWNIVGIVDLVVAVGMGTGLLPQFVLSGVHGPLPAAAAMGVFPMILVPALAVPVSVMLHGLALARLSKSSSPIRRSDRAGISPVQA